MTQKIRLDNLTNTAIEVGKLMAGGHLAEVPGLVKKMEYWRGEILKTHGQDNPPGVLYVCPRCFLEFESIDECRAHIEVKACQNPLT